MHESRLVGAWGDASVYLAQFDTCDRFVRVIHSTSHRSWWRRLALSAVAPVAFTVIYSMQVALAGKVTWTQALREEAVFCGMWWILGALVFALCSWLHRAPTSRWRISAGIFAGVIGVLVLEPTILIASHLVGAWVTAMSSGVPAGLSNIIKGWPGIFVGHFGFNIVLYAAIVVAWHALTYYRDLQSRRLETAELAELLQRAQLQSLRSQLNPHFLFNTLHSIAELVHENPRLAEQMILRLSDLLRKALQSSSAQEVTLAEELDFVRGFLEIEQLRLGDRLTVTWEIAPDSLAARVPSLLLQPLVENAIQHGIAPSTRPGRIAIRARRDGEICELQVHDNGPGIHVNGSSRAGGIGLSNTKDRLARLYGQRGRFELINDEGLRVTIRLPFSPAQPAKSDVT